MLAGALFPSCCPVHEALCAHLDDAALVKLCSTHKKRAAASAMREMARRPVFALLKEISENERWTYCGTMYDVCKTGSAWGVYKMIQKGAKWWNFGLGGACEGGHRDLADLMIQKGAKKWNWGMHCACKGGNRDLVDFMIQHGANNWNWGLIGACRGGNRDVVNLMIQKGATVCHFQCTGHAVFQ